jgi:hypothetical protein
VRALEVVSLAGDINVGHCEDADVEGVVIDSLGKWEGVRVRLTINVGDLKDARVTGIRAITPAETTAPPQAN